ncbi:MAG TPA: SGNH/GDSL hydrolase family protein [Candidatus Baltobacteraceae bacterium]|nr:SGNH/GDSL hydrolase family protein [Candidatus Baltobacteraceae bacterium]
MILKQMHRTLAIAAIAALAACASNGSGSPVPAGPSLGANNGLVQQNFVGIGDSLTFGEQSGGNLGVVTTAPGISALPNALVQPTQTNGFFALMYAQKNNITLDPTFGVWNTDTALGQAGSPLPLIAAPGLGAEMVVSTQGAGFAATHSSCDSINQAAYGSATWPSTRANAGGPIANLGVPGITMHEAVAMTAPLTGPPSGANCGYTAIPGDPTSGNLQSLVAGESGMFYPVLGQFRGLVAQPTQLNDALYLKPQLTTVWLGANDLLKFIFSHGQSPATDSPAQFQSDLTQIVTALESHGSKVVVGNLPDILGNPSTNEPPVPQFFPQTKLSADLQALGVPAGAAGAVASYVQTHYTQGAGGFLTESGFFAVVQQVKAGSVTPQLDPNGAGSGDGGAYLDQAFAAQAIALNAGYNQIINQIAAGTGSGLADVQTAFQQLQQTGVPLPGCTLTLQFGGGLISFDGLHPANTGYALVANAFIGAADTKFSMAIPPLTNQQIGQIAGNDQYNPCVVKSFNPAWPYPLP